MPSANIDDVKLEERREALADPRALLTKLNEQIVTTRAARRAAIAEINGADEANVNSSQSVGEILGNTTSPNWLGLTDAQKRQQIRDLAFMVRAIRDALIEQGKQDVAERAALARVLREIARDEN